jgi:hypothetical protein
LLHRFDAVAIHVHELVCRGGGFDLRPGSTPGDILAANHQRLTTIDDPQTKTMKTKVIAAALLSVLAVTSARGADLNSAEARAIAKEAYIYGYPMVDTQGTILILPAHLLDGRSSPGRLLDGSESGDGELKRTLSEQSNLHRKEQQTIC